jgi:hypothetical protein
MHRRGHLRGYYDSEVLGRERVEGGLETGESVTDRRLQAFLRRDQGRPEDPTVVRGLLCRMWLAAGTATDARDVAEAQLRETLREFGETAGDLGQVVRQRDEVIASSRGSWRIRDMR